MKFRQHVPSFVDGVEPFELNVKNTEELLSYGRFQEFKNHPNFYRFSYDKCKGGLNKCKGCLMAELDQGHRWLVLGYVDEDLDLPKWIPNEAR